MIFTRLAVLVAFGALVFGVGNVVMGLIIAQGMMGPPQEALSRYTALPTTGAVIDRGTLYTLIAVALGTLAEIRLALRRG